MCWLNVKGNFSRAFRLFLTADRRDRHAGDKKVGRLVLFSRGPPFSNLYAVIFQSLSPSMHYFDF